jgi:hypothetical protein
LKQFLKHPGGVDQYPEVTVKYVSGHNPDLIVDDNEPIDLTQFTSTDALHALFQQKGFRRGNHHENALHCDDWAQMGECEKNPRFMKRKCAHSCNKLKTEL